MSTLPLLIWRGNHLVDSNNESNSSGYFGRCIKLFARCHRHLIGHVHLELCFFEIAWMTVLQHGLACHQANNRERSWKSFFKYSVVPQQEFCRALRTLVLGLMTLSCLAVQSCSTDIRFLMFIQIQECNTFAPGRYSCFAEFLFFKFLCCFTLNSLILVLLLFFKMCNSKAS